jgi:hypothetical protein
MPDVMHSTKMRFVRRGRSSADRGEYRQAAGVGAVTAVMVLKNKFYHSVQFKAQEGGPRGGYT